MLNKLSLLTFITITCIISVFLPAHAEKLRVGVAGSPPFVIQDNSFKGISVDIWQELALLEKLEYEFIPQDSVASSIDSITKGELDIIIGPISITSARLELEKVAFTQPYFIANIGLLITAERPTIWSRVRPFFGLAFISSVGLLIVLLFIVGNLLWLAERRRNTEQFPKDYWHGVGNGMWFAVVTLTTVGYGDRTPITKAGRIIAGVWMVVTMVTVSSLTAGIATTLTLSLSNQRVVEFRSPEDIKDARISVVKGSTGERWAEYYGARISQTQTLIDAINLLKLDEVDAVVFDAPALKYYLHNHPKERLKLSSVYFASEAYGFIISPDSPFLHNIDIKLLEMKENGKIKEIESKWLSKSKRVGSKGVGSRE
ncbi:transporter substrate-binding domain-containing protein [Dapis sp. BLCC M126]|uniref:transporter substrate-binding domain-containing protein n=1 Tax=Dapis sp. BLCC M126 TaxID=3400189 RepID=UPI003CE82230